MSVAAMAKKKAVKPKPAEETRESLVAVRCKASWKDWLERFARRERSTPTHLIDKALARLADELKFENPPER